ncbi:hypothetical protein BIY24_03755 [Halobacteriovorax marinus]|uniref:hypothetical protein n=1 Tax=Halobacteriovorax marinus TaxID=97084 RepID=UPI000BC307B2|nr:hypothetical protein [Halobacteriovorax marinus]ATH07081.1 hypothetical protein BIY24_03755 [Halobacteriovorax marinus]
MIEISEVTKIKTVPYESLYLDINNPRFGRTEKVGYEDPQLLFDEKEQGKAFDILKKEKFLKDELKNSMLTLGWYPDSHLIVWEHPGSKGKYVVLEGNCRLGTLKSIHKEFVKMNKESDVYENYNRLLNRTKEITVTILIEKDVEKMLHIMAHLLSVRHISGPVAWKPHARNMYIVERYTMLGGNLDEIDMKTVRDSALQFGVSTKAARSSIQNALIYEDFKRNFTHKLPDNNQFSPEDQQFIEQISSSLFLKEKFGLENLDVKFTEEAAELLFNGSFYFGRNNDERERNIFPTAKSWKKWKELSDYDNKVTSGTSFALEVNLEDPERSRRILDIEQDKIAHANGVEPLEIIDRLIKEIGKIQLDSIQSESGHLLEIVEQLEAKVTYLKRQLAKN